MSLDGHRPLGVAIAIILLVCSLSPIIMATAPAEARLDNDEPVNGNQELISHPSLPYVYFGGNAEVTVHDQTSGARSSVALTGANGSLVSSMDISADGDLLAVACGASLFLIDQLDGAPAIASIIPSEGGNILSLCFGPGEHIYVTYESGSVIDAYGSSGRTATVADDVPPSILRADDARNFLLAGSIEGPGGPSIVKYHLLTEPSAALEEIGRYTFPAGKLVQFEPRSDRIYAALTGSADVQIISLASMGLEGVLHLPVGTVSGVTVSRSGGIVYAMSSGGTYPQGRSGAICAFDLSDLISTVYVAAGEGPIAPTLDDRKVAIAPPLQIVDVGPSIEAISPAEGSAYVYSPGYVRFSIAHEPASALAPVAASVDGVSYPVAEIGPGEYQVNLTSALAAGSHEVSVSVDWGGVPVKRTWSYTSGSSAPSALRPALSLIEPLADSSTNVSPSRVVLGVGMPAPPPFQTSITVKVNNLTVIAVADTANSSRYVATLPSGLDLIGSNTISANASVDGFSVTGSWTFEVVEDAPPPVSYRTIAYGENFSIPSPAAWVEQRDLATWELVITGPSHNGISTNVFVDISHDASVRANQAYINTYAQTVLTSAIEAGNRAEMVGDINYTAISNLTAGVWKIRLPDTGVQEAYALIVDETNGYRWLIKCSASDVSFIDVWPIFEHMITGVAIIAQGTIPVDTPPPTQGYAYYRMLNDYQLIIPDNWTIKRDFPSGDVRISLKLTGPKVGEYHVTILLQNGTDPAVRDDRAWLIGLVQSKFLPELEAKGIEASLYEEPRILSISNHTALVFSIKWTDLLSDMSLVQEIFYIVDEGKHQYWLFTCESPEEAYPAYAQIFDKVAQSFTPLGKSSTTAAGGGLLSDPTTVLMIAVLGITGAAAAIVFLVAQRYRSRP